MNTLKLCIVGYYGHCNLGDEQYKLSFIELFQQYIPHGLDYTIAFCDCDRLHEYTFSESDVIILGGGDVLNEYFLQNIIAKFTGCKNKIIAVSVGLPYTQILVDTNKLDIIDYIFIRTKQDLDLFSEYFHPHRIFYLNDMSMMLSTIQQTTKPTKFVDAYISRIRKIKRIRKKIVALCLSRHVYNDNYLQEYNTIIQQLANFVSYLISLNYHIVFIPFNTNKDNAHENDIIIQQDVVSCLTNKVSHITLINESLDTFDVMALLQTADVCIPMRYHACLFAVYKSIYLFPIFTTRKIKNLLADLEWPFYYELSVNNEGVPLNIDYKSLTSHFNGFIDAIKSCGDIYKKSLIDYNTNLFNKQCHDTITKLIDIILLPYTKQSLQLPNNSGNIGIDAKISTIYNLIQQLARQNGYKDFREVTDDCLQDTIVSVVAFHLTNGSINSVYNFGLKSKMFIGMDYNYIDEWKWVLRDVSINSYKTSLINNPHGLFNIGYIDQVDYSGAHRSGWQYVYDSIKYLHNSSANLLLDLYVDRTFHWNLTVNKILGIVPYKKAWTGFIHHTFDVTFSEYNCHMLFKCEEFLESLEYCCGLFVLSEYLKNQMDQALKQLPSNVNKPPVFVLTHPTYTHVPFFTVDNFVANSDRKVLHIGGWLRNIYSFYKLELPKQIKVTLLNRKRIRGCFPPSSSTIDVSLRKVAVKGKNMNNYYPTPTFLDNLHEKLSVCVTKNNSVQQNISQNTSQNASQNVSQNASQNACIPRIMNNWNRFFYDDMYKIIKSIEFLEHQTNDDYDDLLTKNIVFIHLVDASAINTVIECMVRNTPIIVNNHPAVVELLGPKYPLYFDGSATYYEINKQVEKLLDISLLTKTYKYMTTLKKTKELDMDYFLTQFLPIIHNMK